MPELTDAWQFIYEHAVYDPDELDDEPRADRLEAHSKFEEALKVVNAHFHGCKA